MPVEFKLPDLGEGIHEGEIVEVLVQVGDRVEDGQPVLIVETDKATAEVPAPVTGTVREIRVKPGQTVHVGDVLMVFLKEGESETAAPAPAPAAGPPPKEEVRPAAPAPAKPPAPEAAAPSDGPVPAAPSTRRIARELGVDLRQVPPSGPGGRVTTEDVRAFADRAKKPAAAPEAPPEAEAKPAAPPKTPPLPKLDQAGLVEHVPLRSVRRATAKHLALSWSQIPHVSHMDVADVTELEEFRQKYKKQVEEAGGSLTFTIFMLKAAVSALKRFPRFNSSLDMEAEEILLKHYYNVAVAVDTDRGLIVPVIRDVDRKSILDLSIELKQIAEKAKQNKISLDDLAGGTFTITNIGPLGGTSFNPIINYPQVAILGMARARLQPVVKGDLRNHRTVTRLMLPLNITFDHRVLDGADAARFLTTIVESLENPGNLMLVM